MIYLRRFSRLHLHVQSAELYHTFLWTDVCSVCKIVLLNTTRAYRFITFPSYQVKLDISNLSLERLLEETIEHRTYQFLSKLRDQLSLVPEVEVRSL